MSFVMPTVFERPKQEKDRALRSSPMKRYMVRRIAKSINGWIDGSIDDWTDGSMDGWTIRDLHFKLRMNLHTDLVGLRPLCYVDLSLFIVTCLHNPQI